MHGLEIINKRIVKTIVLEQRLHLENFKLAEMAEESSKDLQRYIWEMEKTSKVMQSFNKRKISIALTDKSVRASAAIDELILQAETELAKLEKLNKSQKREDSKNAFGLSLMLYSILNDGRFYKQIADTVDSNEDGNSNTSLIQILLSENIKILDEELNKNSKLAKIYKRNSSQHLLKIPKIKNKERGISGFKNDIEKSLLNDKKVKFKNKSTLKEISKKLFRSFNLFESVLLARYMFYRKNLESSVMIDQTRSGEIFFEFRHLGKIKKLKLSELG